MNAACGIWVGKPHLSARYRRVSHSGSVTPPPRFVLCSACAAAAVRFARRGTAPFGNALCQQRPPRTEQPRPRALPQHRGVPRTGGSAQRRTMAGGSPPLPSFAAAPHALPSTSPGGAVVSGLYLFAEAPSSRPS